MIATLVAILSSPAFGGAVGSFLATVLVIRPQIRKLIRAELRPAIAEETKVAVRVELERLGAEQLQVAKAAG